jgi:diguanylate cyclase (GGDEF)-like protein
VQDRYGPSDHPVVTSRLYATLAAAGTAILRCTSAHQVFTTLTRVLTDDGAFHGAWVGVPDPTVEGGIRVQVRAGATAPRGAAPAEPLPPEASELAARALAEARILVMADGGRGSVCAMPLRRGDEAVAVFCTSMDDPDAYDGLRLHLLERVADEVAFALQSIADREAEVDARLARSAVQAQLVGRARMQAELARLGQLAFVTASLDDLFAEIVDTVRRVLNLDMAVMEEWHPEGWLSLRAGSGLDGCWPMVRQVPPLGHHFVRRLLDAPGPLVLAEAQWAEAELEVEVGGDPRIQAAAGVAIRQRGEVHGVLLAGAHHPRTFAGDEADFLQSIANIAAAALDHQHASLRLLEQALHDPLTGLPNRVLLHDRLEHAVEALRDGDALAVLLVDLDGFKLLNDALGHDVGDQLLIAVAERLRSIVRGADTVARLGGDEFAVLCVDLPEEDAAVDLAERLAEAMHSPFDLESVQTYVTASIGITVQRGQAESPRALLREADAAMYAAKESGRARYEIFDDRMRRNAVRRLETSNDLRRALDNDEFELAWHPIVSLKPVVGSVPIVSLEALMRWRHPDHGIVMPDDFIGLAEDTGLIRPLGEWVLRAAGEQLAAWRQDHPASCPDHISVNLSAHQLARPCIVDSVHRAFTDAGIEPTAVELEITETALMADPVHAIARLRELRELGYAVAIDDFGTGYSSMTYLRDLPASGLKVDRSFVSRLGDEADANDHAIVAAIIGLAHAVGLHTVAEGVETHAQLRALHAMGCDRAQGFLWTEPLPSHEVPAWVTEHRAFGLSV